MYDQSEIGQIVLVNYGRFISTKSKFGQNLDLMLFQNKYHY